MARKLQKTLILRQESQELSFKTIKDDEVEVFNVLAPSCYENDYFTFASPSA